MKRNRFWKLIAITAVIACAVAALAGCGDKAQQTQGTIAQITYWTRMSADASTVMSSYSESEWAKALQEKTGVKITYIQPPVGQEHEKFKLLAASRDLPDIIEYNWRNYAGGPSKAVRDGMIIDLNAYRDKAPNLFAFLDGNDEAKKQVQTDVGEVYCFPFVRLDRSLRISSGLVVRQDWLDDLGLSMPQTIDDWEVMLTAFKNKKGAMAPYSSTKNSFTYGAFTGAYGVVNNFYLEDGKIKYGPAEQGYKGFLAKMNDWYSKKLIDSNFATLDGKTVDSNILQGISGATSGSIGRGIGKWMNGKLSDEFRLEGAPNPVLNVGDVRKFGYCELLVPNDGSAAITASSKNIDAALKVLDYGYTAEGSMLLNFGIEGESYEMIDGYPTYTDVIMKNPDGLSVTSAMSKYMRSWDGAPFIQDKRYMEQYAELPEQKRAWATWMDTEAEKHLLPPLEVKEAELDEMADLVNAVTTYQEEMMLKFIIGSEPIDKFDSFVAEMKNRGLTRVLEIRQAAYERYIAR